MKKIYAPVLFRNLKLQRYADKTFSPYWYQIKIFNPALMMIITASIFLLLGIVWRKFLVIGITLIIYMTYLYLKTYFLCLGITVRRRNKLLGIELETFEINYEIKNLSNFHLNNLSLTEYHELSKSNPTTATVPHLRARSKKHLNTKIVLDNGMGLKKMFKTCIQISDHLNLFNFLVEFETPQSIVAVHPSADRIPITPEKGNPFSLWTGEYNWPFASDGIDFMGVRNYQEGDPVKRINWRLSMKSENLVVNEFEKFTNSKILIYLEMDERFHFGRGVESTWERSKDLCLGIASHNLANGNSVAVISQEYFSSFGQGNIHAENLENAIMPLMPVKTDGKDQTYESVLFDRRFREANIIWVTSLINAKEVQRNLEITNQLHIMGHSCCVIAVTGLAHLSTSFNSTIQLYLQALIKSETETLSDFRKKFSQLEIPFYTTSILELGPKLVQEVQNV